MEKILAKKNHYRSWLKVQSLVKSRKNVFKRDLNGVKGLPIVVEVFGVVTISNKGVKLLNNFNVCVCCVKDYPVVDSVLIIVWSWPYHGS